MTDDTPDMDYYSLLAGNKIESFKPASFTLASADKIWLTIHADGRVTLGDGLTPDEAGRQAAESLKWYLESMFKNVREEEREACAEEAYAEAKNWEEGGSGWAAATTVGSRILNRSLD